MNSFPIHDRRIDANASPFVVAEIGVNHDGRLDRALELVNVAADCGADAVKLQIFRAETLLHQSSAFADYQKSATADSTPQDMLRRYELSDDDLQTVVAEIRRLNLLPLATPFSPADVDRLEALDLPAIKIASPDIVNWPLLHRCSHTRLPLLISTGAANLEEISTAAAWLADWSTPYALLHCISSYPTPQTLAHLGWISELADRFDVPIGYSDHSSKTLAGAFAVSAGACIIEKHLTHDRSAAGPDHAASADPAQFFEYVRLIRLADEMRGRGSKRVLEIERDVRTVSRQSIVAARDIPAGRRITEDDLTVQRPGTGIPAAAMPALLGRTCAHFTSAGQLMSWQNLADAA
jgi:N,N'-diacetyllegionaminate synthase